MGVAEPGPPAQTRVASTEQQSRATELSAMTAPTLCSLLSPAQAQHPVSVSGQAGPTPVGTQDNSHQVKSAQAKAHGDHDSSSDLSVFQQFLP